jgi:hypothetical protein
MNKGFNNLWPTTVLLEQIEDTELLFQVTQELMQTINFHTPPNDFQQYDILKDAGGVVETFKQKVVVPTFNRYLENTIGTGLDSYQYGFKSWITGTGQGYYIPVHNHSGAHLSAVFYLFCEENDSGGEISLVDPRTNANRGYDSNFKQLFTDKTYNPKTGDVLVFPSYVYHYTHPFRGKIRLAMPVDLFLKFENKTT